MDKNLQKALQDVIKKEIGDMVSKELKIRFKPISDAVETIQKSNDDISEQIREDRKDINQLKIDMAKIGRQGDVMIDNQGKQEEQMVEAVKKEAQKIPKLTEKAVENLFEKKSVLKRIKLMARLTKGGE